MKSADNSFDKHRSASISRHPASGAPMRLPMPALIQEREGGRYASVMPVSLYPCISGIANSRERILQSFGLFALPFWSYISDTSYPNRYDPRLSPLGALRARGWSRSWTGARCWIACQQAGEHRFRLTPQSAWSEHTQVTSLRPIQLDQASESLVWQTR